MNQCWWNEEYARFFTIYLKIPYFGMSMTYTPSMSAKHALEMIQGKRSHILITEAM